MHSFLTTWRYCLLILVCYFQGVKAQQPLINWPTVCIAWIFSVLTCIIIFGICCGISKVLKRNKRRSGGIDRDVSGRASGRSMGSDHTGLTLLSAPHPKQGRGEGRGRQLPSSSSSYYSGRHSAGVGEDVALITRPIQRSVSEEVEARSRRTAPDFTSKWCTQHSLSENTANVLRENGFRNEATLRALKGEDVPALCLPSKAEEVLLREVLHQKRYQTDVSKFRPQAGSSSSRRAVSSGDLLPPSEGSSAQEGSTGVLDKAYSENELQETQFREGLPRNKSTAHSFDVIDEGKSMFFGASSAIELQGANGGSEKIVSPVLSKQKSSADFNGMLSDKGLHSLAGQIGGEWRHLATLLSIPPAIVDQITLDHQGRTRHQIYEMLKLFRDSASGNKEQIKGALQVALENTGRRDLANRLLREQVEGSVEKIPYHSIV